MIQKIKDYIIKNWKSLAFIITIALLILLNVRQYRESLTIYQENTKINSEYAALKDKVVIYEKQIYVYQNAIQRKNSEIDSSKKAISKTDSILQISQINVRKLSKKITDLSNNTIRPKDIQDYTDECDSLALIAPILADQVDTLKNQNTYLLNTMSEKSQLQDSIIKTKDIIISEDSTMLDKTVKSYNTSIDKLQKVESKLVKEQERKGTWKKIAIGLGVVIGGIFALK